MDTVNVLGAASAAYVVIPEVIEKVDKALDLAPAPDPAPSFLTYDLTQGAYNYSFTITDLMTTVASICGVIFAVIALYKLFKGYEPKRRKEDNWPDDLVKDPTNPEDSK